MIFDKTLQFSKDQAITATAVSTNVIDLLANGTAYGHAAALKRDFGKGYDIPLLVQVTESFATATSVTFVLQGSTDEAFTSPQTIWTSAAIPIATLVAGYRLPISELPEGSIYRYMRMSYTVAGSNATAGKVTAGVVAARQSGPAY